MRARIASLVLLAACGDDGGLTRDQVEDLPADRLEGGLDADGAFAIGAWATEGGGQAEVLMVATGTWSGDGFAGTAESRGFGSVDGDHFDCTALYEINGLRR